MIRINQCKRKLKEGNPVFGTTLSLHDPAVGEMAGYAGFDFVFIDNEHVSNDRIQLTNLVRATEISDTAAIIRVKSGLQEEILQMMDLGALGVQVPNVNTREQAETAVKSTKYTPLGFRGIGTANRSTGYGHKERFEYYKNGQREHHGRAAMRISGVRIQPAANRGSSRS
jgi:2,4-dihydroxyhept-2-ene-1,7-dioic acid aldolase